MHRKPFQLKAPLDSMVIPLDSFLGEVSRLGSKIAYGSYTGNGRNNLLVQTAFTPIFVIIMPNVDISTSAPTIAGNMVFGAAMITGATWVPGTGFRKDCILDFVTSGFRVGTNTAVNDVNQQYHYIILG